MEYRARGKHFRDPTDIVGSRFGMLEVTQYLGREPYKKRYTYKYLTKCSCGVEREFGRANLVTGHTRSCGCLKYRSGSKSPSWGGYGEISGRLWGHIRHHAEGRNLSFEVSIEEAWGLFLRQGRRCALTGWTLSLRTPRAKGPNAVSASLDRIDSNLGYTKDNIQWVHKDINWMKSNFDQQRFIFMCRAVASHNEEESHGHDDGHGPG